MPNMTEVTVTVVVTVTSILNQYSDITHAIVASPGDVFHNQGIPVSSFK
jgi:hypothetical protein